MQARQAACHDARTLRFSTYAKELPPIPAAIAWGAAVKDWPMLGNNRFGDCAFAGAAHIEQQFAGANGKSFVPAEADVLNDYSAVTGFDPDKPYTDRGTFLLDALNYWRKTGVCGGRKIDAYVMAKHDDPDQIRAAIYLFGAAYVGVQLPMSAFDQKVWDIQGSMFNPDNKPGSAGGHCVCLVGYDADGPICITWGQVKRMTWRWWLQYADEAYACVSHNWYPTGIAPNNFNYVQLQADAAAFG